MTDVGLMDYWQRRSCQPPNRCTAPLTTKIKRQTRLNLGYVSSAFLLLGCGLVISLCVFLIEVFVVKYGVIRQ